MSDPSPPFIFHPATAQGAGGIALVELYGDGAPAALARLFRRRGGLPGAGEVRRGVLEDLAGEAIDEVLLASVPAESSWCRAGGWTISCHGGPLVVARLRGALAACGGEERDRAGTIAWAAARGALGRLEGDALLLLPGARTARAAGYLLRMAAGELTGRLERALSGRTAEALAELEDMLRWAGAARALVHPRRVLIAGRPNAGKSSLLNRLAGKERAAVTPFEGTTRDLLEETVAVAGFPVVLIDSSGIREEERAADEVEREGIRRARAAATDALLLLLDRPGPPGSGEAELLERMPPGRALVVRTKADLFPERPSPPAGEAGWISALTGEGIEGLLERMREAWLGPAEGHPLPPAPFTAAQEEALRAARAAGTGTSGPGASALIDAMREALVESVGLSCPGVWMKDPCPGVRRKDSRPRPVEE